MIDKMIKKNRDCMGCHACENVCPPQCIEMLPDNEGFLYPEVDYSICIKCAKCIKVCPIINKTKVNNTPISYACINKDEQIRLNSSSGGIFTLLAEKVISNSGGVFGAGYNKSFEVEHKYINKIDDLNELRGSKYVQSKISATYREAKELLEAEREVLFTGTPCQIAGLYSYLGKNYNNLTTQDFICHGVPSPKIWKKYLNFRETEDGGQVKKISFRNKDEGWKKFSIMFLYDGDTKYRLNKSKDLYLKAFLKDICLRPSCYECEFKGLKRQSDITLGDFWGINNIMPDMDDDKGTSLVMINSMKGKYFFEMIKNNLIYKEVNINEAIKYNSAAVKSPKYNPKREAFMNEIDTMKLNKLVNKFCAESLAVTTIRRIKKVIKR